MGTAGRKSGALRCHTGHAFSVNDLIQEQGEGVEEALYTALALMEEKAVFFAAARNG